MRTRGILQSSDFPGYLSTSKVADDMRNKTSIERTSTCTSLARSCCSSTKKHTCDPNFCMISEAPRQGTDYYADQQLASCAGQGKKGTSRQTARQTRQRVLKLKLEPMMRYSWIKSLTPQLLAASSSSPSRFKLK